MRARFPAASVSRFAFVVVSVLTLATGVALAQDTPPPAPDPTAAPPAPLPSEPVPPPAPPTPTPPAPPVHGGMHAGAGPGGGGGSGSGKGMMGGMAGMHGMPGHSGMHPGKDRGPRQTDHDRVVGHWGVEARRVHTGARTPDLSCSDSGTAPGGCPVSLNSFGVRKWTSHGYAWNLGAVVAAGGGSERRAGMGTLTRDTYLGFGATSGANFLLGNWHHLAVSMAPQVDVVFFAPSGSASKTVLFNARGVIEGEVHLGFIGLPALSVGTSAGLMANFTLHTKDGRSTAPADDVASEWSVGTSGPTSLWGVVTDAFVRLYF